MTAQLGTIQRTQFSRTFAKFNFFIKLSQRHKTRTRAGRPVEHPIQEGFDDRFQLRKQMTNTYMRIHNRRMWPTSVQVIRHNIYGNLFICIQDEGERATTNGLRRAHPQGPMYARKKPVRSTYTLV